MPRLTSLEQLAAKEFSKNYLWDIDFPDFGQIVPAVSVEENIHSLSSHELNLYNTTIKIPLSTSSFDLKISFVDYEDLSFQTWLADWVNQDILGSGVTATVEDATKPVIIYKLGADRSPIKTLNYLVYPEGSLYFTGDSESGIQILNQDFVIAGS